MTRFRLARQADSDLDEIADFIADHNPTAALQQIERLYDKFRLLAAQPLLGESCEQLCRGLRRFVAGGYVIYYMPRGDVIEIERVLHGARDVTGLF
jgi:toxin ParE1/3/4